VGTPLNLGDSRWNVPGAVIAFLLAGVVFSFIVPASAEYMGFFGLVVGLGTACVLFVTRSARLTPRERGVWRIAAVTMSLFVSGVLAFAIASLTGARIPAFGPLDTFFLAGYLSLLVVFYKMTRLDSGGREWALTIADALVGAVALAALVWSYWFDRLTALWSRAPTGEVVIATLYPILDVMVVVGLLILVLRRSHYHLDLRLLFFASGAAFQVFGDFIYMSKSVGQTFTTAEPLWPVNLLAATCLVATAAIVDRVPRKRDFAEAPTPVWALMWPYLFVASLLWVHLENYRALDPGISEVVLLDAVILIGVIIFLRQVYVIYRDRHHVDRKRAELVASVSHELRTPLTAMVGFMTLLDEHPEEFPIDARQEMISEATAQARHMSRLVSDLLMLARGDTSYLALEIENVKAMSIVTSVLRSVEPGDTRIEEDLDAEALVHVDPDRMKQALGNLVDNAIRYGDGHCLLVARVKGDDLILEVHDNGPGVPERFQTVVWEQFERGSHRLDAVTPGLGIGLSIVEAVVQSHGGRAEYRKSERLGGACFSLIVRDCVVRHETRPRLSVGQ
jgi:signal transduction histidine kinase